MTSTLRETLHRVTQRVTEKILAEQFLSAVSKSLDFVLLFAAIEGSCFAGICLFYGVFHDVFLDKTCHVVFEKIAGLVA